MKKYIFAIAVICLISLTTLGVTISCNTPPKRKNYKHEVCYRADYCGYLKSKKEKSDIDCGDIDKECRTLTRYILCKDENFRWPEQNSQGCWDKLNSK